MTAESTSLLWRGSETIDAAKTALANRVDVELHLPAGFHHAVFSRFAAPAVAAGMESVDIVGGAELLTRLADIRGLEPLVRLETPVLRARATVHVVSPSPTIAIICRRHRTTEPALR